MSRRFFRLVFLTILFTVYSTNCAKLTKVKIKSKVIPYSEGSSKQHSSRSLNIDHNDGTLSTHVFHDNVTSISPNGNALDGLTSLETGRQLFPSDSLSAALNAAFNPLAVAPPHYPVQGPRMGGDVDNIALGSSHGWGWKDQGWGWGWPQQSNNGLNAVGLLGLLGLLNLLATLILLLTTTTTTTAAGRKKRDVGANDDETNEAKRQRIFQQILPLLVPVAHARNGVIPWECTLQGVCLSNKILVKEYGIPGRVVGQKITTASHKLKAGHVGDEEKGASLNDAGKHGRNLRDCEQIFPSCKARDIHSIPFILRMEDVPHLFKHYQGHFNAVQS